MTLLVHCPSAIRSMVMVRGRGRVRVRVRMRVRSRSRGRVDVMYCRAYIGRIRRIGLLMLVLLA